MEIIYIQCKTCQEYEKVQRDYIKLDISLSSFILYPGTGETEGFFFCSQQCLEMWVTRQKGMPLTNVYDNPMARRTVS